MSQFREPPLTHELPEMLADADEVDDPVVYKILDIQIAKRREAFEKERASRIVRMLDDGVA